MRVQALFLITAVVVSAASGTVEKIQVHGVSLEGNLIGDSPDRQVTVWLPPSYAKEKSRRYPVVYMLHGFTDSDEKWFRVKEHWIHLGDVLDKAAADIIVVMPNADNAFAGSMYSSSVTIGDWETFIARDLVKAIDARYRTLSAPESRGLAGHSMGGYGTLRIGMRHPEVFSAIYALSPCCLAPSFNLGNRWARLESIKSLADLAKSDFGTKAAFASAASWSANPGNPPFYVDLPWKSADSPPDPQVTSQWIANAPLITVTQHLGTLRGLRGVALDAGDRDGSITTNTRAMHELLERFKVPHLFEMYLGDHLSGIAQRIETKVMPFFQERLASGTSRKVKTR